MSFNWPQIQKICPLYVEEIQAFVKGMKQDTLQEKQSLLEAFVVANKGALNDLGVLASLVELNEERQYQKSFSECRLFLSCSLIETKGLSKQFLAKTKYTQYEVIWECSGALSILLDSEYIELGAAHSLGLKALVEVLNEKIAKNPRARKYIEAQIKRQKLLNGDS